MEVTRVVSKLVTDVELLVAAGERFVIRGVSHPTTDGYAVTEGVPAEAFRDWMASHADSAAVAGQLIFAVDDGVDLTAVPKRYGFEPALQAALDDGDQVKLHEAGAPSEPEGSTAIGGFEPPVLDVPSPPKFEPKPTEPKPEGDTGKPAPSLDPPQPAAPTSTSETPNADEPNQDLDRHVG